MSDERRKKQQERESNVRGKSKTTLVYLIILVCFGGAFLGGRYYKNHRYDSFARCLATRNTKMYGLYWCPHCAEQKQMFGSAFRYVPYVECAIKDKPGVLAPACQGVGVKLFPSWQFGNEPPKEGELSLQDLSAKTGCSLQ